MSVQEYWIGKGVNYNDEWRSYTDGLSYIEKFRTMRVHLLRIELREFPTHLPLFNHEVVYKTIKGYFHDLKQYCLSPFEYDAAGPLFLYSVDRASGIWNFLGELPQILLLGTTLAEEKVMGQQLENLNLKLSILRQHFGEEAVNCDAFQAFMLANTPLQLQSAVERLFREGIDKVQISTQPFNGNMRETEKSLIVIKELFMGNQGDVYNAEQVGAMGREARSDNNTFIKSEQKQTLVEATTEIQRLLKQLEQTDPHVTEAEKVVYLNDETTPSFKRRVVGALQASSEAALDEFILENKYLKVAKAAAKGWLEPGS